jgi:hypothetical protein
VLKPQGKKLRSSYEELIRDDLDAKNIKYEYEKLKLTYVKERCSHCGHPSKQGIYTPDFVIGNIIVECKGRFESSDRTKMLNVQRDNKEISIRLLFQRDNKLNKTSKRTYTQWAKAHNFICAVGNAVPEEWLREA